MPVRRPAGGRGRRALLTATSLATCARQTCCCPGARGARGDSVAATAPTDTGRLCRSRTMLPCLAQQTPSEGKRGRVGGSMRCKKKAAHAACWWRKLVQVAHHAALKRAFTESTADCTGNTSNCGKCCCKLQVTCCCLLGMRAQSAGAHIMAQSLPWTCAGDPDSPYIDVGDSGLCEVLQSVQ